MARGMDIRKRLEELKAEIIALRNGDGKMEKTASQVADTIGAKVGSTFEQVEHQIGELNKMVKDMLEEAETTASVHPVATVAGALALGIVIGRVTSK